MAYRGVYHFVVIQYPVNVLVITSYEFLQICFECRVFKFYMFGFSCQQVTVFLSGVPKLYTLRCILTEHLIFRAIFPNILAVSSNTVFVIALDKSVIIRDSIISAVTFAIGYSVSSVQHNKTLSPSSFFKFVFCGLPKF